jgi:FixJ family two-component response regulator
MAIENVTDRRPYWLRADARRTDSELARAENELTGANVAQAAAALKVAVLRHAHAEQLGGCATTVDSVLTTSSDVPAILPALPTGYGAQELFNRALVYVVDHDAQVRAALRRMLEANGLRAEVFADGAAFLMGYNRQDNACLLADTELGDLGGLKLLLALGAASDPIPVIMITGRSDIGMAVDAMNAGAVDFIEKPIGGAELVASVMRALANGRAASGKAINRGEAEHHFEALTVRQRQIMILVLAGHPSKNIAADLGISQRTVENHRAAIMRKSGSKSLPGLARLTLAAGAGPENPREN